MTTNSATRFDVSRGTGALIFHRSVAVLLAIAITSAAGIPAPAKTAKTPDPTAVEAKVMKLGVGEHVMVKLVTGRKLRGHIVGIGEASFTLQPDRTTLKSEIAYDQVLQVKKNPGPIFWMLVGAAIVIVAIVAAK